MTDTYQDFLARKVVQAKPKGLDRMPTLAGHLHGHQRHCVEFGLRVGSWGCYLDTGLGKTAVNLEWSYHAAQASNGRALIVTPLAVGRQFEAEGKRWGYPDIRVIRDQAGAGEGLNIINYDRLHLIDPAAFGAVALDESSILKSFTGQTSRQLREMFASHRWRASFSATPAPNDHMELGQQCEFLGVMPSNEMLARWFISDQTEMGRYRLKGHAVEPFWDWIASWARAASHPRDLGFEVDGYDLEPIEMIRHRIASPAVALPGQLFASAGSATDMHAVKAQTAEVRAAKVRDVVAADQDEPWLIWCDTNNESEMVAAAIARAIGPGHVRELTGSQSPDEKEDAIAAFLDGSARVLVTKPSIAGWGLNFQHCARVAFVGRTHSFESYYQAVRRVWRYGQTRRVQVHLILDEIEDQISRNVERKSADHGRMIEAMRAAMVRDSAVESRLSVAYLPTATAALPSWIGGEVVALDARTGQGFAAMHGDCVPVVAQLPDSSVDLQVFSPPFSGLYIYSDSIADMGNSADDDEFLEHYQHLAAELHRVLRPGRSCVVHCKDLVYYKNQKGTAGLRDLPGMLIRAHQAAGFDFHSRITIWRDPVREMTKTKAHGLLYKQLRADASFSRQGLPEYFLIFRKWSKDEADEALIRPVTHTKDSFPLDLWQKWASPVWMDTRETDVLQAGPRPDGDEKHICLARGSLVLTFDGYRPIETVEIGDLVLTHTGRWMPVTAKACLGERKTVRTTAQGVADLRTTPDHKLWVRKGRTAHPRPIAMATDPEWVAASESLGHWVNLQLPPVKESDLSALEWWIVGRWLGDGHLSARGLPHISCSRAEADSLVEKLGRHAGHVADTGTSIQVYIKDRDGRSGGRIHRMIKRCGVGASGKLVPGEALELSCELAESLLDGYLSADGHRDARGHWHASSVSRALVLGMAMVAQRARGVVASVYKGRSGGPSTIQGRAVNTKPEWKLTFAPRHASPFMLADGAWKKVRIVKEVGVEEVWDIQVAEDESFTAEGCVVHNCPLPLDLIRRAILMWSNPGDVVLTPFMGIGSEAVTALKLGRKAIGVELKREYWRQACEHLNGVDRQASLFGPGDFEPAIEKTALAIGSATQAGEPAAFISDILAVSEKHGLSISHEDNHGAFLVEPKSPKLDDWLSKAQAT